MVFDRTLSKSTTSQWLKHLHVAISRVRRFGIRYDRKVAIYYRSFPDTTTQVVRSHHAKGVGMKLVVSKDVNEPQNDIDMIL